MSFHAWLALSTLAIASVVDLRERRIPNRLLALAILIHVSYGLMTGENVDLEHEGIIFISLTMVVLLFRGSREWLLERIGMGDIKLIAYLLLTLVPQIGLIAWTSSISAVSLIALLFLLRARKITSSLPLAPILGLSSVIALVMT